MFTRCYPTISDWINDIFGTNLALPVQSFGFFVALAFIAAAVVVSLELKRKEKEGLVQKQRKKVKVGEPASLTELAINGFIGFIIGFKLLAVLFNYESCVADPQGFVFSLKGNFIGGVIGAVIGAYLKYREKAKTKLDKPKMEEVEVYPHQLVGDLLIVAAISGFIGAKVFNFLEAPQDLRDFMEDPGGNIFSGLTIYGGLIFGAIGVIWYARKNNINILQLADASAPALILAYGIGRIGCHVAGDGDWGIDNTSAAPSWIPENLWSYTYPHNIINEGVPIPGCEGDHCFALANPVYPTPIYETIACIIIFGILWSLRKRIKVPGMILALYLVFNGIERFFIERIRINTEYNIFGMTPSQAEIISLLFVISGIGLGIYFHQRYKKRNIPKPS